MAEQVLKIDLSRKSCEIETIPDRIIRQYLGGRGLGAYLLYTLVPGKADPLGEDNYVIFSAGPANGTNFYYSSKTVVTTKSPLTGIYLYSISSGSVAHQMRKAGFRAIAIRGIADSPAYIAVNNQDVEFKDASSLSGMDPAEAQRAMLAGLSGKKAASLAIGLAGEDLVKSASIFSEGDYYRAFGRGGSGCVMGSKRLKGMIISGDGDVEIANNARFEAIKKTVMDKVKINQVWKENWRKYGTGNDLDKMSEAGMAPSRNWQGGTFERWAEISTKTTADKFPRENRPCGPYCPSICSHYISLKTGPYQGAHCDGPEWETIYAFGTQCGVDKFDAIVAAAQICDEYGIDTMTAGVTIGFAMECFERGLLGLKDTDGVELRFGNDQAMITMLKKLVTRDGFGSRLAEGVRKLSREISGSEGFAMHSKGLELGGYECRGLMGQALEFAISNRGGCHHAYGLPARVEAYDGSRLNVAGKGQLVKNAAIFSITRDSIPVCSFSGVVINMPVIAEAVSALTGEEWSVDDLHEVGERIMCQERLFNMREGVTRKDDSLPARLLKEPVPDGPAKGSVVPLEELLDDYYRAMDWDLSTGGPADAVIQRLEIAK